MPQEVSPVPSRLQSRYHIYTLTVLACPNPDSVLEDLGNSIKPRSGNKTDLLTIFNTHLAEDTSGGERCELAL